MSEKPTRTIPRIVLIGCVLIVGVLVGTVVSTTGMIRFARPSLPDVTEIEIDLTAPVAARIVDIEPIRLDCRARVHAVVPVEGRREHVAFGRVYRTDRVSLRAFGDVDTCVHGSGAEIVTHDDGTVDVSIDARSIRFVRPRVDAVRTASSVQVDKDQVGKLIDAFPWVDDNMGLTPVAYAYAQNVIGSSRCAAAAYDATQRLLVDAYHQQAVDQGFDAALVTVTVDGEPEFPEPEPLVLGDVHLYAEFDQVQCYADHAPGLGLSGAAMAVGS
jgi:hypothetical protein